MIPDTSRNQHLNIYLHDFKSLQNCLNVAVVNLGTLVYPLYLSNTLPPPSHALLVYIVNIMVQVLRGLGTSPVFLSSFIMQRLLVCVLLANQLKTGDEGRDLYKQPASDHLFEGKRK